MRKIALLAGLAAVAGCAHPAPLPGPAQCRSAGLERFVGKVRSEELGKQIRAVSRASLIRWVPPGTMVTMDFRPDRVTVSVDEAGRVTQIRCG